ncbi:DUF2975 domain-containing protein [Sphingomonas radiodurans]|uniref:DUF2975 domain-containing protein n=1 Tax=Sphingomonas radiodurans TaxID=2890321 RepID=UPI001E2C22B6|nr:DUF2975 domain-containing protein [Sphingomonas radiodurans]WBH15864.1 DUF2975 domain-containing protein [Sphingomonas radiodurans]
MNGLLFVAIAAGLASSWAFHGFYRAMLVKADPTVDVAAALLGIRLLMLIGVAMTIASDRLLVPLASIAASAAHGDPFAPANAAGLRQIGWALLALQMLDVPCALLARFWPSLGAAAPAGDISVGGWLATLMVFVLARVFATGSAMRDDLAGTV